LTRAAVRMLQQRAAYSGVGVLHRGLRQWRRL